MSRSLRPLLASLFRSEGFRSPLEPFPTHSSDKNQSVICTYKHAWRKKLLGFQDSARRKIRTRKKMIRWLLESCLKKLLKESCLKGRFLKTPAKPGRQQSCLPDLYSTSRIHDAGKGVCAFCGLALLLNTAAESRVITS